MRARALYPRVLGFLAVVAIGYIAFSATAAWLAERIA